jgi:hypothetical protein
MLVFHIIAGLIVLLNSIVALSFSKGGRIHRASGNLFFLAFLCMTVGATFITDDPTIAILATYYVATAWAIVLRPEKKTGYFEIAAFIVVSIISIRLFIDAMAATRDFEIFVNYLFGSVAAISAMLDLNMIVRGGLSGAHRIARHLWRMCYALLGAVASFTANTSDKWPEFLNDNSLIYLVVAIMFFWLFRVLFTKWFNKAKNVVGKHSYIRNRGLLNIIFGKNRKI